MHKIIHPSPSFSGRIVACARAFDFTKGEATAAIGPDVVAVLRLQGFTVEPVDGGPVAEPISMDRPKRSRKAKPVEIHDAPTAIIEDLPRQLDDPDPAA